MLSKEKQEELTLMAKLSIVSKMLNRLDYPESAQAVEEAKSLIQDLQADSRRYRWLRDNKHLDIWWSIEGPEDRCENIDCDIDEAIEESENNDDHSERRRNSNQ